jgi:hypothetical protein
MRAALSNNDANGRERTNDSADRATEPFGRSNRSHRAESNTQGNRSTGLCTLGRPRISRRFTSVGLVRSRTGTENRPSSTLRARDKRGPPFPEKLLLHGTIIHGFQLLTDDLRYEPTSYFGPDSGLGRSIRALERQGPIRVGIIGLGAGVL